MWTYKLFNIFIEKIFYLYTHGIVSKLNVISDISIYCVHFWPLLQYCGNAFSPIKIREDNTIKFHFGHLFGVVDNMPDSQSPS